MAFTYRPSEETEKIMADYMKRNPRLKEKSKCVSFFIDSRPKLDAELGRLKEENRMLKRDNENLRKLFVSEQFAHMFDVFIKTFEDGYGTMIKDLKRVKAELAKFRKGTK